MIKINPYCLEEVSKETGGSLEENTGGNNGGNTGGNISWGDGDIDWDWDLIQNRTIQTQIKQRILRQSRRRR